jgi:hypothetical protein
MKLFHILIIFMTIIFIAWYFSKIPCNNLEKFKTNYTNEINDTNKSSNFIATDEFQPDEDFGDVLIQPYPFSNMLNYVE